MIFLDVTGSNFFEATFNFILSMFKWAIDFLKSIKIYSYGDNGTVSLFSFMIAVIVLSVVVAGLINVVRNAPLNGIETRERYGRKAENRAEFERRREEIRADREAARRH